MFKEKDVIVELKKSLEQQFGDTIKDVILFGSRSAGTAHEDSDFDVLVIVRKTYDWRFREQVSDVVYDLELKYDILIDQFLISTDELEKSVRGAQPVFVNAIKNGMYA